MEFKPLLTKFVKFGIVGASGFVIHGGLLYLLRDVVGINQFVANIIGFVAAASSNYFLNRVWTFRSQEKQVAVEYLKFFIVSVVGLGINSGTLWLQSLLLPDWAAEGDPRFYILWIVAVAVTTLWNFFGNLLFTFRGVGEVKEVEKVKEGGL
jgi:putative flippase GtrA